VVSKEERRWVVFENGVLCRVFGPNGEEVMGDLRKQHAEELHNVHFSLCISRMIDYEDE
jgi:hypothetical protein